MADVDPKLAHEVGELATTLLTIRVELDATRKSVENAEAIGIAHARLIIPLEEMLDMIEEAFGDLVEQRRDELAALGGEPLATTNAKVKFSLIQTNPGVTNPDADVDDVHPREFVVIEPNDSFFAERNGEYIKPPTITIELAPR